MRVTLQCVPEADTTLKAGKAQDEGNVSLPSSVRDLQGASGSSPPAAVVTAPAALTAARRSDRLVLGFDLVATFVFALGGGLAAVQADLDLLGVLVLAFITALGGGIIRDVMLPDTPPAALRNQRYPLTAFLGGVVAFVVFAPLEHIPSGVLTVLDAAGLSLFAVSGASKSLLFGAKPLTAVLLGAVGATGGGVIRDVLLNRVPTILYADVYATAALLGATVTTVGIRRGLPRGRMMALGGVICFVVRVLAAWQHWHLPHAGHL